MVRITLSGSSMCVHYAQYTAVTMDKTRERGQEREDRTRERGQDREDRTGRTGQDREDREGRLTCPWIS